MAKYITTAELADLLKTPWTYIEAALHGVQPRYIKGTIRYPLHDALSAIADYSDERLEQDGFIFHSTGKRCDTWRDCKRRTVAALDALDKKEAVS